MAKEKERFCKKHNCGLSYHDSFGVSFPDDPDRFWYCRQCYLEGKTIPIREGE